MISYTKCHQNNNIRSQNLLVVGSSVKATSWMYHIWISKISFRAHNQQKQSRQAI